MFGPALRAEDFSRLLKRHPRARSAHFALYHESVPQQRVERSDSSTQTKDLSTDSPRLCSQAVDDWPGHFFLGLVLPKRLAPRAVTRNLLRRQIRAQFRRAADSLPAGRWLVRQREAFDKVAYQSAASKVLAQAAREELMALLRQAKGAGK